jgi:hypothetical protein
MPHPLPEVNFLMVEIPTLKPYIFMIRVTRQIKCLIAQAPRVIPHPLTEVIFLMVEILTPVGDGDDPGSQLLGHLICLFTLIIIYMA